MLTNGGLNICLFGMQVFDGSEVFAMVDLWSQIINPYWGLNDGLTVIS